MVTTIRLVKKKKFRIACVTAIDGTPYEAIWGENPDVSQLLVFGTNAYVWIPKQNRLKFDAAAQKMTFAGYSSQQKAFQFLDRTTGKIVNSRAA